MTCLFVLNGKSKILFFKEKFFEVNYDKTENKNYHKHTCQVRYHVYDEMFKRLAGIYFLIPKLIATITCKNCYSNNNKQ